MPIIRNAQRKAAEYQQGLDYPRKHSRSESKVIDTAVVEVGFQSVADEAARLATGLTAGALVFQQDNEQFYLFSGTFSGANGYSLITDWTITYLGPTEWQNSVLDVLFTPPGGETIGDRYLVGLLSGDTATGAWVDKQTQIAEWNGSAWEFFTPTTGTQVSDDSDGTGVYLFNGTDWTLKLWEATTASGNLTRTGLDITLNANPALEGTEAVGVPSGTTAQRNGSPTNGDFRYNSDTGSFEGYQSGVWDNVGGGAGVTSFDAFVADASATSPGTGLIAAADGQSYVLSANTGALHGGWGVIDGVGDGDIVEYKGGAWLVAVDVSDTTVVPVSVYELTGRLYHYFASAWTEILQPVTAILGVGTGAPNMGSYTGTVLTDNTTAKANIQELGTSLDTNNTATGLNTTHRSSDGTNHANVVLNDAHRGGDGSDHADVAANTSRFESGGVTLKQAVSADRTVVSGDSYFHPRMTVGAGETVTVASGGYMLTKSDVIAATGTVTVDAGGLWEVL